MPRGAYMRRFIAFAVLIFSVSQPLLAEVFVNGYDIPIHSQTCLPKKKSSVDVNYGKDYPLQYSYSVLFIGCTPKNSPPGTAPEYHGMVCSPENVNDMDARFR